MPKEFKRTDRLGELLQRELAVLIQKEIKDPRLGLVTVNAVQVTRDLAYAKVYVTFLVDDNQIPENLEILNNAASFLRTVLAKQIKVRTIPQLQFVYDASVREGSKLSSLIDAVIAKDEQQSKKSDSH
jgi:ribosome-binding factor A